MFGIHSLKILISVNVVQAYSGYRAVTLKIRKIPYFTQIFERHLIEVLLKCSQSVTESKESEKQCYELIAMYQSSAEISSKERKSGYCVSLRLYQDSSPQLSSIPTSSPTHVSQPLSPVVTSASWSSAPGHWTYRHIMVWCHKQPTCPPHQSLGETQTTPCSPLLSLHCCNCAQLVYGNSK